MGTSRERVTFTTDRRRMTDGISRAMRSACSHSPEPSRASAFSPSTSRPPVDWEPPPAVECRVEHQRSDHRARILAPPGVGHDDPPGQVAERPTPVQVGDHVVRLGFAVAAVLRLQAEAEVVGIGQRQRTASGATTRVGPGGTAARPPWATGDRSADQHRTTGSHHPASPRHRIPHVVAERPPADGGRRRPAGRRAPSPPGRMPCPGRELEQAAGVELGLGGGEERRRRTRGPPSRPRTASRRSSRLATDATARPTSVPARSTHLGAGLGRRAPVMAAMAVPDASASRQPRAPQAHGGRRARR